MLDLPAWDDRSHSSIRGRTEATGRETPALLAGSNTHDAPVLEGHLHVNEANGRGRSANDWWPDATGESEEDGFVGDPDEADAGFCDGQGDHSRPDEANIESFHFL